jgi:AcrR family transcriptional regulator
MARLTPRSQRKPAGRYHHGDLRRALIEEAVRTIQSQGVEHLTLRKAGENLGVSRTALYRHFADKPALLAAVGCEGFRMLREALSIAWEGQGRGQAGFDAMGAAYITFAVAHPSHYRVMFGRFVESSTRDEAFETEAKAAFDMLVGAIVDQQQGARARPDDPVLMAQLVWSLVHGIAMLAIDGQLCQTDQTMEALTRYMIERVSVALAPTVSVRSTRSARKHAAEAGPVAE